MSLRRWLAGSSLLSVPVLLSLGTPGCTTEAYCFVCESRPGLEEDGGAGSGAGGNGPMLDAGLSGGTGGSVNLDSGVLPEGGPSCTADTENDPNNCGMCGTVCSLLGAFATCVGGECVIDDCAEGYKDLNMEDSDGCEYACPVVPEIAEECNGVDDDCDGEKDEDFDLTTVDNCGSCGNKCILTNATAACEDTNSDPDVAVYQCVVDQCDPSFHNNDGIDANGCEYECEFDPPVAEICNDKDEDCDGRINNDVPSGAPCGCPAGGCVGLCTPGAIQCVGTQELCVGGQGPQPEICDGEDNDCDGTVDNGFNTMSDVLNCGGCGIKCELPNAVPKCENGMCAIAQCIPGYANLTNAPGCEHQCAQYPTSAEVCDGVDNDCDGQIDEGVTPPPNFCRQTGPCAGATASCVDGAWRCNYQQINANIEVNAQGQLLLEETRCDNFDGDCDGQVDESFVNKNTPCAAGQGVCARSGTFVCNAAGTGTQCSATPVMTDAKHEVCNGKDDNCDGQIDERNPVGNPMCGGVPCQGVRDAMVQVGSFWIYQYEASRPDAETTDVDNTRACSKPNVPPWTSVSQAAAAAACAAVTNSAGQPMRLCTEQEWQQACLAGNSAGTERWSYSSGTSTYESGVCNDRSRFPDPEDPLNLPQAWVTGFDAPPTKQCRTSTNIFDLSGNVAEWTSTSVNVFGQTYYRVRGGSFLTYGPTTSCQENFVLNIGTFQNHDVGFRCCSGAAP